MSALCYPSGRARPEHPPSHSNGLTLLEYDNEDNRIFEKLRQDFLKMEILCIITSSLFNNCFYH